MTPARSASLGIFCFAVFLIITPMLRGTSDVMMVGGESPPCCWSAGVAGPIRLVAIPMEFLA